MSLIFPDYPFRLPSNKFVTSGMFVEHSGEDSVYSIFTKREEDNGKFMSFPKLYMSYTGSDPTEYVFAETVLGGWSHWMAVCTSTPLRGLVRDLRNRNAVRIKSNAIKNIVEEMNSGGRSSFSAAKLLLDKGWIPKEDYRRKTKAFKEDTRKENSQIAQFLKQDAERLGIKVN